MLLGVFLNLGNPKKSHDTAHGEQEGYFTCVIMVLVLAKNCGASWAEWVGRCHCKQTNHWNLTFAALYDVVLCNT
jgi:hypothetical protein